MGDSEKADSSEINDDNITFDELSKLYKNLFARYAYVELAFYYDDSDTVNSYINEMEKVHKLLFGKWSTTKSKHVKEDLAIMSNKLGDLMVISSKKWTAQQ